MSRTTCEEHYHALCKIFVGSVLREQLGKGAALERSQDIGHHAYRAENLRDINTVHDRGQHTDLVSLCAVDILTGTSSPEITAADDNTDLDAVIYQFLYLQCHLSDGLLVESGLFLSCQCFTTEFQ